MDRRRFMKTAAGLFVPAAPALLLPTKAWPQSPVLPGPGLPVAAASGPIVTNISRQTAFTNTTTQNYTINVGTSSAGRLIVVGLICSNVVTPGTMTINSTALTQDAVRNSSKFAAIYTGSGTSFGSGSQTLTVDYGITSFEIKSISVWTVTGLLSNSVQSGNGASSGSGLGGQILNISAASAGNPAVAFCAQNNAAGTTSDFTPSTQNAANTYNDIANNMISGDWSITSTNASFTIQWSGGFSDGAAASYR